MPLRPASPCPCGGHNYATCCQPLHVGAAQAETAEALMRSRYSAFAVGDTAHLWRTWHPRTRPDDITLPSGVEWLGLEITDVSGGGPDDDEGVVAFIARYREDGTPGAQVERSTFARRGGRWVYVGG